MSERHRRNWSGEMSTPKSSISVGFSMKYTIQLLWYHHLWKPPYRCFFTASCRIAGSILVPSQVPGVEGSTRCLQRMLRDFGSPILGLPENRLPNPSKSSKFSDSASISHIFRVKIAILWVYSDTAILPYRSYEGLLELRRTNYVSLACGTGTWS